MKELTPRQLDVYLFMLSSFQKNHSIPTRQEVANHFNFSSCNSADDHVNCLVKKGYLTRFNDESSPKAKYRFANISVGISLTRKESSTVEDSYSTINKHIELIN